MLNNQELQELENAREEYKNVEWKSSGNVTIRLWNIDDSYLMNIMRSVSKSLTLAKDFPNVVEFQSYNDVAYTDWVRFLSTEYDYRAAQVEARYLDVLELEIQEQLSKDRSYYDDIPF